MNISICVPQNRQAKAVQVSVAYPIRLHSLRFIVLPAVQFNDDLCGSAVEIYDIPSDDLLTIHGY